MPPLSPPADCVNHLERRSDDTLDIIENRLRVWLRGCSLFFRMHQGSMVTEFMSTKFTSLEAPSISCLNFSSKGVHTTFGCVTDFML